MKPRIGDVTLAVMLAAVGVVGSTGTDRLAAADRPVDAFALVIVAAAGAVLVIRRRRPLVVLAITTGLLALFLGMSYPYGPIWFPFIVAVYTVSRYLPLSTAVPAALSTLPFLVLHLFTHPSAISGPLGLVPASAWLVVPFAVGVAVRLQREASEQKRTELVSRQVYEERLRVVQEVHDVVGHGLAAINMQANIALHLISRQPEQAELSLTAISRTSQESLTELRSTLAVVKRSVADGEREPVPGLDRLDELIRRTEDAGVEVRLDAGESGPLPAAVDFAAYRVLQEAFTNVLKHSQAKLVTVRIRHDGGALTLTVSNSVKRTATPRAEGLGLPGMRERVAALGGELTAEFTDDRFEVHATIPTKGDEQ